METLVWIVGGLIVVMVIVGAVALWKNRKMIKPATIAPSDVIRQVLAGLDPMAADIKAAIAEEVSRVPSLVSGTVTTLQETVRNLSAQAKAAQAGWDAEKAAHDRLKAAVAVIKDVPIPLSPPPAPIAEGGQAGTPIAFTSPPPAALE